MGDILTQYSGALSGSEDVSATKDKVLEGYTAITSDSDDEPIEGTLPNKGVVSVDANGKTAVNGYVTEIDSSPAFAKGAAATNEEAVASVMMAMTVDGRTVTATASNGKTASASVDYGGGTKDGHYTAVTTGGTGNEDFDIKDGYITEVTVDRTGAYDAGRKQGQTDVRTDPHSYGIYSDVGEKTITSNGTYEAKNDGVDGYSTVYVEVSKANAGNVISVDKNVSIVANGDYTYLPSEDGADAYSSVEVNVKLPDVQLLEKTITKNGNYDPTTEFVDKDKKIPADGYSKITVAVPKEPNLRINPNDPCLLIQGKLSIQGYDPPEEKK